MFALIARSCILALLAIQQPSEPPQTTPNEEQEHLKYPQGYVPEPGSGYFDLSIAPAISQRDWIEYAAFLTLSDAQRQVANKSYDDYRREDWSFRKSKAQTLWDRSALLHALGDVYTNSSTAEAFGGLMDDRKRLLPQLFAIEDSFFADIEWYLADEQRARLETLKQRRMRKRYSAHVMVFPGNSFDLDTALYALESREFDVVPLDKIQLETLLAAYRSSISSLFQKRYELALEVQSRGMLMIATATELVPLGESSADERNAIMRDRYRLNEPWVKSARDIHDLNSRFVDQLSTLLQPETAIELRRMFRESTYAILFPDASDLDEVFDQVNVLLGLTELQRTEVKEIFVAYDEIRKQLDRQLIEMYLMWHETFNIRMGYTADGYEEYRQKFQKSQLAKAANSDSTLTALETVLSGEQLNVPALATAISEFRQRQMKHNALLESGQWPGPHD